MTNAVEYAPDWDKLIQWDRKYYMQTLASQAEYVPKPIAGTDGSYMIDHKGRKILDMHNGSSVNAGHRNRRIIDSITSALERHDFVWESYLSEDRAIVSQLIVEELMGQDGWAGKAHFVSSGSEAVEEALFVAKAYTQRSQVITMNWSYHGWTAAAGSCTAVRNSRNILIPRGPGKVLEVPGFPSPDYHVAPTPFAYRCSHGNHCNDCDGAALDELEKMIVRIGPQNVAALITDIVLGGAVIVLSPRYVEGIREITRKYGIVWIDDEVITGFGRTGRWFCYQHYDVRPDIVVMGKGISSNYIPTGGIVISREIADFFAEYRWSHLPTNSAHPISMAAVRGSITSLRDDKIVEKVADDAVYVAERLAAIEKAHGCVGHYEGMGLLWGIEIVRDKKTREPVVKADKDFVSIGDTSKWPSRFILQKCLERGVYLSGIFPNTLRIIPPLTVTRPELDQVFGALDYGLSAFQRDVL